MRIRLEPTLLGLILAVALLVPAAGSAAADNHNPRIIDREEDCLEAVPEQVSYVGVTDEGQEVSLEVLVLLDGVPKSEVVPGFELVVDAYERLGIHVVPTFRKAKELSLRDRVAAQDVIEATKELFGGERPEGFDVVYTITGRESLDAAGKVDCIGGIRYPTRAFGMGFDRGDTTVEHGPLTLFKYRTAKIATHEIAHLLGAHHHYANCAEGDHADPTDDFGGECTVMMPDIFFVSTNFGALESVVVRGHAVQYADQETSTD